MKISVLTLGCKVNQSESFFIKGALQTSGHKIVGISENPDLCIINTCTVTAKSDYQSRQLIRRANRAGARIFVTGCYSELNKKAVMSMDGVEAIIDNSNKLNIIKELTNKEIDSFLYSSFGRQEKSRLFVKIQDGCNYLCSYCAITKARGISKSVEPEKVICQVNNAVSLGYSEIVLSGIHLGLYGADLIPKAKLSYIIKTILNKTKIKRIRLSSLEVREVDDEMLELFSDNRICKHLHIPLQSGDDKILRLMNRTYSSKRFLTTVESILKRVPEIALGTDIIVGFPGEEDEEFQNTYTTLERLPVSYMHIFTFSARPGTKASEMPDSIASAVKKMRARILESLNKRKKKEYMDKQTGETLDVLIEKSNPDNTSCGTSGNYLKILMPSNNHPCGTLIYVRVQGIKNNFLCGIPI